jgi:hypothetical protein
VQFVEQDQTPFPFLDGVVDPDFAFGDELVDVVVAAAQRLSRWSMQSTSVMTSPYEAPLAMRLCPASRCSTKEARSSCRASLS